MDQQFNLKTETKPYDIAAEDYPTMDYAAVAQVSYDRQAQALQLQAMDETSQNLAGIAYHAPLLERLDELQQKYPMLSQDDLIAYYESGSEDAKRNHAVFQAVEMVNELPIETAVAQRELTATYRELLAAGAEIDPADAWTTAASLVVEKYAQQEQNQISIGM